jgi:hypothetical protein
MNSHDTPPFGSIEVSLCSGSKEEPNPTLKFPNLRGIELRFDANTIVELEAHKGVETEQKHSKPGLEPLSTTRSVTNNSFDQLKILKL